MALYNFPDPNDRSANAPSIIVTSKQVLGLYNQNNEDSMQKVTTKVQSWFLKEAKRYSWNEAKFSGNQCILEATLEKKKIPQENE